MNSLVINTKNQLDPFAAFGTEGTGQVIRFTKTDDWFCGKEKRPVRDRRYIAHIGEGKHGYTRWENNQPMEHVFGRIADFFRPPARDDLGHLDESRWPTGLGGKPQDPWQYSFHLPLLDVATNEQCTWIGSSWGAKKEFKLLNRQYAQERHKHPGCVPVVQLTSETVRHPKYGPQAQPRLPVLEWRTLDNKPEARALPPGGATIDDPRTMMQEAPPPAGEDDYGAQVPF